MMPPLDMMQTCAPTVAPKTLAAIIQVESGGNSYAIGVNGPIKLPYKPSNAADATRLAKYVIRLGYSVDLGLMQINSRNLQGLGYTVEEIFDSCHNLQAGARILTRGYLGAVKRYGHGQDALRAALSAYNTGNYERGFKNGYVAKYYRQKPKQVLVREIPFSNTSRDSQALPQNMAENPYTSNTTIYKKTRKYDAISE